MSEIEAVDEGCCPPLVETPLSGKHAAQLAAVLKALSDPARLRLFSLIASHPAGEVCACELVEPLGITQPTVSHHLRVLTQGGLLARERRGKWIYYRARRERLAVLNEALASGPAVE